MTEVKVEPTKVCEDGATCGGTPPLTAFRSPGYRVCQRCSWRAKDVRLRDKRAAARRHERLTTRQVETDGGAVLLSLPRQTQAEKDWQERASCRGTGLDWWTNLDRLEPGVQGNTREALSVCAECPVRVNCRDLGDLLELPHRGQVRESAYQACIYGGETPTQRRQRRARSDMDSVRRAINKYVEERQLDKVTLLGGYFTMQTPEGRQAFIEDLALKVVAINDLIAEDA